MTSGAYHDKVERSIVDSKPQDRAEEERGPGSGKSEGGLIESMRILKISMDYTMVLAVISLLIMTAVLMLQGFRVYGFYLDTSVVTVLVPSLSATAALGVLGRTGRGVMAPRGRRT